MMQVSGCGRVVAEEIRGVLGGSDRVAVLRAESGGGAEKSR